ncbi:hypothetical protein [Hymenobacter sp. UV11]|nr:hypothetical protein [Hymenobacter sp. UV11]
MESCRPTKETLSSCGFRPSMAADEWCHMKNIHLYYFRDAHALEVYNGPIHPRYNLTSQNDDAFQVEVQVLASAPAYNEARR